MHIVVYLAIVKREKDEMDGRKQLASLGDHLDIFLFLLSDIDF